MRVLAFALPLLFVAALLLPAAAQPTKQVDVVNLPEVQEVARFQLVGFTFQDYDGDMGGWFGTTEKCQIDFAEARICTIDEVRNTTTIPFDHLPSGTNAWAHDVQASRTCSEWTVANTTSGGLVSSDTGTRVGTQTVIECTTFHPIACCALVR